MQKTSHRFPQDIYAKDLYTFDNIHFTPREIDTIACFVNGRGTSKTASLLSVAPNTIFVHTRNIMTKIGCNSRESIIDFVEKSNKLALIGEYYTSVIVESEFIKALQNISILKGEENWIGGYVYGKDTDLKDAFIKHLVGHLKHAGIHAAIQEAKKDQLAENIKKSDTILLVSIEKKNVQEISLQLSEYVVINLREVQNYYIAVFEILKKLLPHVKIKSICKDFVRRYTDIEDFSKIKYSPVSRFEHLKQKEIYNVYRRIKRLKNNKIYFVSSICCVFLFGFVFQFIQGNKEMQKFQGQEDQRKPSIRSDLFIPVQSVLLSRTKVITQIEEKFKGKGIQVVGLIGPGGAGKTTMARQYARQQDANVIWELNAETNENLKYSFESLAQALAKSPEDRKILRSLQETRDPAEKEEQLILFVKERLKSHSHWFLIYDNMEKFTDIQKYFPQDPLSWGEGKIILTTRNSNIQNNSYLNGAIQIKELNDEQKFTLFTKIITTEEGVATSASQVGEVKEFLQQLPPYPLDIVVAAYYLKAAKISYAEYLENLEKNNKDIALLQEDLLKGAGNYTKTRYGILTLSLQDLINKHKDFKSLLLFISLLDSQNIPRKILTKYKNNVVIDHFIYNLKKYSIITDESPHSALEQTISFHRSTQEIILDYLVNLMIKKEQSQTIYDIFNAIEQYTDELIEEEDFSKIQLLAAHYEAFLKHNSLLDNPIKNVLDAELGNIYYFLGDSKKGKELLEVSIEVLDKPHCQKQLIKFLIYLGKIYVDTDDKSSMKKLILKMNKRYEKHFSSKDGVSAKILSSLGDMYDSLGYYEKAKALLQNSVIVNKKYAKNYPELAWSLALLGNVCRKMGKYSEAKDFLEESLGVYKSSISENHFRTGWILIHLGNIYAALGEHKKAHRLIEEGVTTYKKCYPENHPDLAWATSYLGHIYTAVGEYERAQELLQKTLMILKRTFSESHGTLLRTNAYLANAYMKSGSYQEARNILEQVVKYYEQMNDPDLIEFAMATQILAEIHFLENHTDAAENLMNKALGIFTQHKHPHVLRSLESLTEVYLKKSVEFMKKGNIQEAKTFKDQAIASLNQAVEAITKHFPADSPHIRRIQLKFKGLE